MKKYYVSCSLSVDYSGEVEIEAESEEDAMEVVTRDQEKYRNILIDEGTPEPEFNVLEANEVKEGAQ